MLYSKISFKKILKLWIAVATYSWLIYLIFLGQGLIEFEVISFLKMFVPVLSNQYWFVTAYFIMYLLSPILNVLILNLQRKMHFILCCAIFLVCFIVEINLTNSFPISSGYNSLWFLCLYIFSGYIRKYDVTLIGKQNYTALFIIICFGFRNIFGSHYTSPLLVANTILIFLLFKNLRINRSGVSKIINAFASTTFGIYLIHDNDYIRGFMYDKIFSVKDFYDSSASFLIMIIFIFATFFACAILEFVRLKVYNIFTSIISRIAYRYKIYKYTSYLNEEYKNE